MYKIIERCGDYETILEADTVEGLIKLSIEFKKENEKENDKNRQDTKNLECPMTYLDYLNAFTKLKGDIPPYIDFIKFLNNYYNNRKGCVR